MSFFQIHSWFDSKRDLVVLLVLDDDSDLVCCPSGIFGRHLPVCCLALIRLMTRCRFGFGCDMAFIAGFVSEHGFDVKVISAANDWSVDVDLITVLHFELSVFSNLPLHNERHLT